MWLEFEVSAEQDQIRLGNFLRRCGVSAALIRSVKYTQPGILADGVRTNTNQPVRAGQRIGFFLPPEEAFSVRPQAIPLRVVYETSHLALIDKPAGMAVHPTLNYPCDTLANGWAGRLAAEGRQGPCRPVNRIDKGTSGLVLCAKNAYAAAFLPGQVEKVYLAVAEGEMPPGEGTVDAPIGRGEGILQRCVVPDGQPSRTHYQVLASGGGYSLLRVRLETGRTHQIRVHMAHIGHPLAGDWLYGHGPGPDIQRQALHCFAMCLPTMPGSAGGWVYTPPPEDMQQLYRKMHPLAW